MFVDDPVWQAMDGDAELARLEKSWRDAVRKFERAMRPHCLMFDLMATSRTVKGLDVLIPPQRPLGPSQGRRVSFAELNGQ